MGIDIAISVTFQENHSAVAHNPHCHAREMMRLFLSGVEAVKEPLNLQRILRSLRAERECEEESENEQHGAESIYPCGGDQA